jgi:DNA-binding response OmpR family regulator
MSGESHVVLLVEDDLPTAAQVTDLLSVLGYRCLHASTQEEALQLVERGGFCVVLLDLEIKRNAASLAGHVEAGQGVLAAIRHRFGEKNRRRIHWLPVMIMSGHASDTDVVVEMMRRGADDCLQKLEKDRGRLAAKIEALLERTERDDHARCADVMRLARSGATPAGGVPVLGSTEPVTFSVPGRVDSGRDVLVVDGREIRLQPACFLVLLHLVVERVINTAGWVHSRDMGAKKDRGWQGIHRLRDAVGAYLPVQVDENDRKGSYRLHPKIAVGSVDADALGRHENARVRQLADRLRSRAA